MVEQSTESRMMLLAKVQRLLTLLISSNASSRLSRLEALVVLPTTPRMKTFHDQSDPKPREKIQMKMQIRISFNRRFRVPVCHRKYLSG